MTDLCVLLCLAVVAFGVVVPHMGATQRENANRVACAGNLRNIAQHLFIYANSDVRSNRFPRLFYDARTADAPTSYTGAASPRSFGSNGPPAGGPAANDVSGALYLGLKNTDMTPDLFVCPSDDARRIPSGVDVQERSNFAGRAELSYSYSNPYPSAAAVSGGWKFNMTLGPDFPLASDMNYGDSPAGGPTKVAPTADRATMASANSANHRFAGQNVAFCDIHVEWQETPFCGPQRRGTNYRDNIFASAAGADPATGKGGTVRGAPQDALDAVMLPAYADGPQPAAPPARKPTDPPVADVAPAAADAAGTPPGGDPKAGGAVAAASGAPAAASPAAAPPAGGAVAAADGGVGVPLLVGSAFGTLVIGLGVGLGVGFVLGSKRRAA